MYFCHFFSILRSVFPVEVAEETNDGTQRTSSKDPVQELQATKSLLTKIENRRK